MPLRYFTIISAAITVGRCIPQPLTSALTDIPASATVTGSNPGPTEGFPISGGPDAGPITVETTLWFDGDSGCGTDDQNAIKEAYRDALMLAASVEHPELVLGHRPGEKEDWDRGSYDYFGPRDQWASISTYVEGNFRRAKLPNEQWWLGDWRNGRYLKITCSDPTKKLKPTEGCKLFKRAYTVQPNDAEWGNPSDYPLINICKGEYGFFGLKTLTDQLAAIRSNPLLQNDVSSLVSRGSAFLHETYHTEAKNIDGSQGPGVSQPRCVDVVMKAGEKAYGAARAKFLARSVLGGADVAYKNVDNYVSYTLSRFMMKTFSVPYPTLPKASWTSALEAGVSDGSDTSAGTDGDTITVPDSEQLTDEQLYAGEVPN